LLLRYPEELADRTWDNVGLLQENIEQPNGSSSSPPVVMLTNDLTIWVADEAIRRKASVIVSYRKSTTLLFLGLPIRIRFPR
jgi:putative NIF3 family GTP cyclohydrolase 1 type 2